MSICITKKSHALWCGIFLMIVLIIVDQLVKWFVLQSPSIETFCNYGIAMSVMLPPLIFILVWGGIMIAVVYFWIKNLGEQFLIQFPLILILAGGLSNLFDRVYYGCVVDYVPFLNISHFNFADVCITVGAGLVLWQSLFEKQKQK
jgi:signal peptidase II